MSCLMWLLLPLFSHLDNCLISFTCALCVLIPVPCQIILCSSFLLFSVCLCVWSACAFWPYMLPEHWLLCLLVFMIAGVVILLTSGLNNLFYGLCSSAWFLPHLCGSIQLESYNGRYVEQTPKLETNYTLEMTWKIQFKNSLTVLWFPFPDFTTKCWHIQYALFHIILH